VRLLEFDEIDSTNLEAKRMAEAGDFGPLWITATRQSDGKGRRGREWVSETGNLFCTGLFPHSGTPASAARLSFAAALAVHDTVSSFQPDNETKIKWPNDVLLGGAKISGILLESGTTDGQLWVAIGIGINITSAPDDTKYAATYLNADILQERHSYVSDTKQELFKRFEFWLEIYTRDGFEPLRVAWLERAQGMGDPVTAKLPNKTIEGKAIGMDAAGALELKTRSGETIKIHAGDVFFS
jgi:BirA family transcriptional regulator, biotin operon repressor / biotin---[acetyl-CoA-carboxylase] ligase